MTGDLAVWLIVWLVGAIVVVGGHMRADHWGSGLLIGYIFSLWTIHWVGGFVYLLPWYGPLSPLGTVITGVRESALGVVALAFGSTVLHYLVAGPARPAPPRRLEPNPLLPPAYLIVGVISYVLLYTLLRGIPTATALVHSGQNLFLVGICLYCWISWRRRQIGKLGLYVAAGLLIPFITIVVGGFLGYGFAAVTVIAAFLASFIRPRRVVLVSFLVLGFLGLSLFVTYFRSREDIRRVVWAGAPVNLRVQEVVDNLRDWEWFDPKNHEHLASVDTRLNHNAFLGTAVERLEVTKAFANGRTLVDSVIALVPRAIWPTKPQTAGSGDLVRTYTGLTLSRSTSWGIGHPMEFHINFGSGGVVVGFAAIGLILAGLDRAAKRALVAEDWQAFCFFFLIGLSFLNVGGSVVELSTSATSSLLLAGAINMALRLRSSYRAPADLAAATH